MRHRPHTFLGPFVAAVAALALLAAGCGDGPADPAPLAPVTTASPEAPVLVEPDPAPEPTPELKPPQLLEPEPAVRPQPEAEERAAADTEMELPVEAAATTTHPRPSPIAGGTSEAEPEPEPEPEPEDASGPELAPCPQGQHRHHGEPCHYDDPEPEPVQAEPQPENAVVELEDEPDSDEVHPHTTDTAPDPPPVSGVFPSAHGEQPTIAWQVHVSGIVEGARPLPTFTLAVQAWSDWCFFDWATRDSNLQAARQQCAIQLSLIGLATEMLGITDQCATRQYRGQLEMLTGEGEFDFVADFGRVGWHACPSVIDTDPSDDIASPYFDVGLYEASLMPDDECMRASWAAEVYLQQHGIWMAEWRC